MQLHFSKNYAWKYILEASDDNINWETVIDQSDNSSSVNYHYNYGNLGHNVQFIRIKFNSEQASIAEIILYGGDNIAIKQNLLNGTVIGTTGSWSDDPANTRDAVFDFNINTFFDAPSSIGWAGLDLGSANEYQIDSIRYAPRSGDYHLPRLKNGKFEIADNPNFTNQTLLYQVIEQPSFQYYLAKIDNTESGRYVRYISPSDGFGNISEVEFYGKKIGSNSDKNLANKNEPSIFIDRNSHIINISFNETIVTERIINLFSTTGSVIKQVITKEQNALIAYNNIAKGSYIVQINSNDSNYRTKVIL